MQLDVTDFPRVWIRLKGRGRHSNLSAFQEFEALLARKEIFVLLNDEGLEKEDDHSQAEMKQTSLWMKRNKSALRAFVAAAIYIEPHPAKRLASKAFSLVYGQVWGFPMLMVASREEALQLAEERLLSSRTASDASADAGA